jgi:hypothetical protein
VFSCSLPSLLPQEHMRPAGGYLVENTDGLLLVAFPASPSPGPALRWAVSVVRACLHAPWPQELLEHELGE